MYGDQYDSEAAVIELERMFGSPVAATLKDL